MLALIGKRAVRFCGGGFIFDRAKNAPTQPVHNQSHKKSFYETDGLSGTLLAYKKRENVS